jgi:type III secretion protein L
MFEQAAARWHERGRPVPVTIVADRALARGSCLCETDIGSIDASLTVQLDALRMAVRRATAPTGDADPQSELPLRQAPDAHAADDGAAGPASADAGASGSAEADEPTTAWASTA